MITKKVLMSVLALTLSFGAFAQSKASKASDDGSEDEVAASQQLPESIVFECEAESSDLSNSSYDILALRTPTPIFVVYNLAAKTIMTQVYMTRKNYGVTPSKPLMFYKAAKADANSQEVVLLNQAKDADEKVIVKKDGTGGTLVLQNAEINFSCELSR